jgi:hypothetical protein
LHLQNLIIADYHLKIVFDDGLEKNIDIKPFIKNGVSAKLKEEQYFAKVQVVDGFITWPNGFDFYPVFLYQYNN